MITRTSRRALPAAVAAATAAALLAGCTSGGGGSAAPTAPATASATTATATPAPTPTPKPTGANDPALKTFYGQQLAWAACKGDSADDPALQCATLQVPLDYSAPATGTLDVAVVRFPAAKPDQRVGSLVMNPGGPGGSGVSMVKNSTKSSDGPLHDRFDLVGFDPRGVAGTSPLKCLDDQARDSWISTDQPGADHGKQLADACQAKYAKVLPFVSTRNTARDMDVLRAALGDQKLSYLGMSYGTYLGSLYAEEFPDKVGRLVLDGATDPATTLVQHNIEQQAGFERALKAFAADCVTKDACPLGKDADQAVQKLADFLDGLKDKPLKGAEGRTLTANEGWTGVLSRLYGGEKAWSGLRNALGWAMARGKGDYLLDLADGYNGRDKDGRYADSADAYTAIHCADGATDAPTGAQLQAALTDLAAKAPLVSKHDPNAALFDPDCRIWPFRSAEKPHAIKSTAAAPIVVVGTTGDPATPYAWAEKLTQELGNAVLLTREGEGHTAYGASTCIRASVDAFLVDGTVPAAGTRCQSD
ncbi:alpha/beta hydrolase [Streptomyces rubellomurinus]|uniref:Peptidase S33 family protein n=1 Tax=Streptomyces rubellomurinus (strain ATCC 31215) TaxID=359131 RepID=A0A0F2TCT9_STRR3|nr:alpha/beta hydrolase [Streptomyces rubellomurinus]KJS60140.1 peptidase S33 family protein [Streptomyces rubellomurinus]